MSNDVERMDEKKSADMTVDPADLKEGEIKDLDQAEIFLRQHNITHDDLQAMLADTEGSKKLVRRVDFLLMPLLCGTYLLQYIDKQVGPPLSM